MTRDSPDNDAHRRSSPAIREFIGSGLPTLRLFAFPHAGAGGARYRPWGLHLAPAVQVCPVVLPGRECRYVEPPFTNLGLLARVIVRELEGHMDIPFALAGVSLGAILAYEIAHLLNEKGMPPVALFVAAHRAPRVPERRAPLHGLNDDSLVERLRALGGMPPQIVADAEILSLLLGTIRADLRAIETYIVPQRQPLSCPLYVYAGRDDVSLDVTLLDRWRAESSEATTVRVLPGGHFMKNSDEDFWLLALKSDMDALLSTPALERGGESTCG